MGQLLRRWLFATLILPLAAATAHAQATPRPVDAELVLAVDSSASISNDVLVFQLAGHAAAFRDEATVEAILSRPGAAVAVTLIGWSGPGPVETLVPWMVIASRDDAGRFADAIDAISHRDVAGTTAVGNLIDKATGLFGTGGARGERRILDISSNGFSNAGLAPDGMRDLAVARGITINALVILDEYDWLEDYYRENVIGGPDAFVMVARSKADYAAALRDKLVEEIASAEDGGPPPCRPMRCAAGANRPPAALVTDWSQPSHRQITVRSVSFSPRTSPDGAAAQPSAAAGDVGRSHRHQTTRPR